MERVCRSLVSVIGIGMLASLSGCPLLFGGDTAPTLLSFSIEDGSNTTSSRAVHLDNTAVDLPTHYLASESADFAGAEWWAYSESPVFTLSAELGTKTVYFKLKNFKGESGVLSDSIELTASDGEGEPVSEGEIIAEGEGESVTEGEGEAVIEGEGELLTEGEGEAVIEGEGELLAEGEGEAVIEGEGELLAEGEGEIFAEGEGESLVEETVSIGAAGLTLVHIAAGTFIQGAYGEMGGFSNEMPAHFVTFHQDFWIGKYEITQAQWAAVMGENPSYFQGGSYGDTSNHPVERVSWDAAQAFCAQLSTLTGQNYRLPTEAEWEYACRAGTSTPFYWGAEYDGLLIEQSSWFLSNSSEMTHPVGTKSPNAWGLYDIGGSVWEWVSDWFGDYGYAQLTDPAGPESGSYKVRRGGSFYSENYLMRSALRSYALPSVGGWDCGLRVVRTP